MAGLLWMFSGAGAEALMRFFLLLVLARILSPADFGAVGAAITVVNLALVICQLGVGPALIQRPDSPLSTFIPRLLSRFCWVLFWPS